MHVDPILPVLCALIAVVLAIALMLRRFRQPLPVVYILAGVLAGPDVLGVVRDVELMSHLGSVGVVLLLFFVGLELDLARMLASWRVAVFGTIGQILASVAAVWALGAALGWPVARITCLGFVISLSSTAVVMRMLAERGETETRVGRSVIGILIVQDLALIPMLLVLGMLGGDGADPVRIGLQIVGGGGLIALVILVALRNERAAPLRRFAALEPETRLLTAGFLCFGLALLTSMLGLSSALGAFIAGVLIASSGRTDWIHESLTPFRVVFLGAFFLSVGMLIDLQFLLAHWGAMAVLIAAAFLTNTFLNAIVLRLLGETWREGLYAGAMLAQIGELSFVLVAIGFGAGVIGDFAYQATVGTIALTLILTPAWAALMRRLVGWTAPRTPVAAQEPLE